MFEYLIWLYLVTVILLAFLFYHCSTQKRGSSSTEAETARYSVERHGDGWAIYKGRDQHHHGANLGRLTECDEVMARRVEEALNGLGSNEAERTEQ